MKILCLEIKAFGKLKNVKIELHDGINTIQNVNGFGKTTVAAFIRAMLYGLSYNKVKGVSDVTKYAPWDGDGKFGGSMAVQYRGETYNIERYFGLTARQSSLNFVNGGTGKAVSTELSPGEYLLGLTAESYDRSAYFPQEAVEMSSNDNFDSRLANIVQNSTQDYDKIQNSLRAYKKNLRYERGYGGEIYELEQKRTAIQSDIYNAERARRRNDEIERRLDEITREKATAESKRAQLGKQLAYLQGQQMHRQPTPEEQSAQQRMYELKNKLARIPARFDQDFKRCEQLSHDIESAPPKRNGTSLKYLTLAAIIIAVLGVVIAIIGALSDGGKVYMIVGGASVACAGIVVIIVNVCRFRKDRAHSEYERLSDEFYAIADIYVNAEGRAFGEVRGDLWQVYNEYLGDLREYQTLCPVVAAAQSRTAVSDGEADKISAEVAQLDGALQQLSVESGRLEEERKNLSFDTVSLTERLAQTDDLLRQAQRKYDVADKVSSLLEKAKDNLSSSYLPKLCARCSQLLSQITSSDYRVTVDRNFAVTLCQNNQTHPMSEYSRGIREITLLCFRVALSELLYDGNIPFIVIDDAFVNFDEDNFKRATQLLKSLASSAQVLYFTCHGRLGSLSKRV